MCNDPSCIYRRMVHKQAENNILAQYRRRYEAAYANPQSYNCPPFVPPDEKLLKKLVIRQVRLESKYWKFYFENEDKKEPGTQVA